MDNCPHPFFVKKENGREESKMVYLQMTDKTCPMCGKKNIVAEQFADGTDLTCLTNNCTFTESREQ